MLPRFSACLGQWESNRHKSSNRPQEAEKQPDSSLMKQAQLRRGKDEISKATNSCWCLQRGMHQEAE